MAFFDKLRNLKIFGGEEKRKTKVLKNVYYNRNPNDSWEIIKELGDGAFGKVYMMKNLQTNKEAALKQVKILDDADIEDHSVEINILSELKHRNVVTLQETYFYEEKLWMFLEYCGGGALDVIMLTLEKPLSEPQIACVSADVCRGLDFLHRNFVIHRDMKASNLLLTTDGCVKIADFGVSARNDGIKHTRDSFMGTPYWMAPEVVRCETLKDIPYSYKIDVWSFGVTLIECAQMHPPHHDMHPMRVLIKITKSDPPTLSKPSTWSRKFNNFLEKCLTKDPEFRPSASELLQHPFVAEVRENLPLKQLLSEATAEVTEEIKEEMEDEESGSIDMDTKSSSSSMNDIMTTSEDENEKLYRALMMSILDEVIMSVQKKPSIPGVVYDTIMDIINDEDDSNDTKLERKENHSDDLSICSLSNSELEDLCESIYMKILDDVLHSTNRQPSISGSVLNAMTDIIKGIENENKIEQPPDKLSVQIPRPKIIAAPTAKNLPTSQNFISKSAVVPQKTEVNHKINPVPPIRPGFKRTLTKTRRYFNPDGQLVTTSTSYILNAGDEQNKELKVYEMRRRDMRNMKSQQKVESKQLQELVFKDKSKFEKMALKFEENKQLASRSCDIETDQIMKAGRQQIDKIDENFANECRIHEKRMKFDQEKSLKTLLESQKKELKTIQLNPNEPTNGMNKKDALKHKKEQIAIEQIEKERKFREDLDRNMEIMKYNLKDDHKRKVAAEELKMLQKKQQLIKVREEAIWNAEEALMKERHDLIKQHLREKLILKRQHMMSRHNKEIELLDETNKELLADLLRKQNIEKRKQPKLEKLDSKVRCQTFKKKIKEDASTGQMLEKEKEKLFEFEERERRRLKENIEKMEQKHNQELTKLQTENQLKVKDLEQIQKDKLNLLLEQENEAIKELDEQFKNEFGDWEEKLDIKKSQLQESFRKEIDSHNEFYFGKTKNLAAKTSKESSLTSLQS